MRLVFWSTLTALCCAALMPRMVLAGNVPQGDLTLFVTARPNCQKSNSTRFALGLERELRLRGYTGEISHAGSPETRPSEGNFVAVTLIKSGWKVKKAFSIPYLLNRYRRVFSLEVELAAGSDSLGFETVRLETGQKTKVEAQLFSNDRYDPDLFSDQSERFAFESEAWSEMSKALAARIGDKFR